jgi:hypothetical protein
MQKETLLRHITSLGSRGVASASNATECTRTGVASASNAADGIKIYLSS